MSTHGNFSIREDCLQRDIGGDGGEKGRGSGGTVNRSGDYYKGTKMF